MTNHQVKHKTSVMPALAFSHCDMALQQMLKITEDLRNIYEKRNEALIAVNQAHHKVLMRLAIAANIKFSERLHP